MFFLRNSFKTLAWKRIHLSASTEIFCKWTYTKWHIEIIRTIVALNDLLGESQVNATMTIFWLSVLFFEVQALCLHWFEELLSAYPYHWHLLKSCTVCHWIFPTLFMPVRQLVFLVSWDSSAYNINFYRIGLFWVSSFHGIPYVMWPHAYYQHAFFFFVEMLS